MAVIDLDMDRLDRLAREAAAAYQTADPFPHIVIDDFVPAATLDRVLAEVQADVDGDWNRMDDRFQRKFSNNDMRRMGPATRALIHLMNGQEVIGFLEELTGITGLVADWQLSGGGLHALREGGFLNVHADFNRHQHLRLDRRINLLLYLNKDWPDEFGGALELWDRDMVGPRARITPDFNRCVIFNTTDKSYHGNPQPIHAPDGRTRLSLAFYYYTNGRPEAERSDAHATLFQYRPGEASARDKARRLARRLTPPIVTDWLDRRRRERVTR